MLIVFDVGNTETTVGLFDGDVLRGQWRYTTRVAPPDAFGSGNLGALRTNDDHEETLRRLLRESDVPVDTTLVTAVAIASVVSDATAALSQAVERVVGVSPLVITAASAHALSMTLDVDEPLNVGIDRIINTFAAHRLYHADAICVDLGTASTFDCITADGVFLGGVIMPGVHTAAASLVRHAPRLADVELRAPDRIIGRNTDACIRAGVLFGAADAIDGLVGRIKAEWPREQTPIVIATGGLVHVMRSHCRSFDRVEPTLTLVGIRLAHAALTPS